MLASTIKSFARCSLKTNSPLRTTKLLQQTFLSTSSQSTEESTVKKHTKLKIPTKRCAALLQQLNIEGVEKSLANKEIDNYQPGDSVEIEYILNRTTGKTQRIKGVVIAKRNRVLGTSFLIRNHIGGYGYEQKIFLHSPLLKSVKVLRKAAIHKGRKRVRRAKLFYLREKPPGLTTV